MLERILATPTGGHELETNIVALSTSQITISEIPQRVGRTSCNRHSFAHNAYRPIQQTSPPPIPSA